MKSFRKIYISNDENLNRVQDSIASTFSSLENDSLLNRVSLSASIGAVPEIIAHNLGRTPQGWVAYDLDANAVVWRVSWNSTTITLQSSAPVNIKFYTF